MIPFNIPPYTGNEIKYIRDAIKSHHLCGDGKYTKICSQWLERKLGAKKILLTTSGTAALEMSALLCDIKPGDEVILPSFTFPSTATAFLLVGAKLVFVDIRSDTMNIDENKIEAAITPKTKAICVMHYGGVSCEMRKIAEISQKYRLKIIEDAAQGILSTYYNAPLGTIGDIGCYSFHETKNYSMGEGGAKSINNEKYTEQAEMIREKGTNRTKFIRGEINKYYWVTYGSSYLPSELNAAHLWGQLISAKKIYETRINQWNYYYLNLIKFQEAGLIQLPTIPKGCKHNAHLFYIKLQNLNERNQFQSFMKQNGIICSTHYIPLHSSPAGLKFGRFNGEDVNTTNESNKLIRLPLYYNLPKITLKKIIAFIEKFFENKHRLR